MNHSQKTKLDNLMLDLRAKLYDCHKLMQEIDTELNNLERDIKTRTEVKEE